MCINFGLLGELPKHFEDVFCNFLPYKWSFTSAIHSQCLDLISSWSNKLEAVPPSHCIPLHERPVDPVPVMNNIPVIDLGKATGEERAAVVQQLLEACEEYGFFQLATNLVCSGVVELFCLISFCDPISTRSHRPSNIERDEKWIGVNLYLMHLLSILVPTTHEDVVEPAKSLVGPDNPPLFKSFKWGVEFMPHYLSKKSVYHAALEPFKIDA
ncbi:hypothetical protein HAX54_023993 [Datura stramonium]|uniref:Non-haem dioxygenase N-terminal domain-containing protein n=1 Tax=Datura stramonium TaxID=4076 RepID=A0ABS8UZA1_DATST|nr:hypothetical protein [Datura stramonium]